MRGAFAQARLADHHLGERLGPHAPARIEQTAPEGGTDVDVDDEQVFLELPGAGDETPALVEQHRRAVEDELVLAADEVHVEQRNRRVGRTRREHRLPFPDPARVVGRRVDVHDELGATGRLGGDRAVRAPRVFTDRHRDPNPGHHEERTVDGGRREVALLVEHRVVGQQVLVVDAEHVSVRTDRGRVVEISHRVGEAHHRGRATGARRELVEHFGGTGDERLAQQQVFGRVARERELGKGDEVAAGRLGLFVGVDDSRRVAVEIADDHVELRRSNAEPRHAFRIRDTARMAGGEMVLDDAALVAAIDRSADAPTARTVVARVIEARPEVAEELAHNELLRDGLVALACASRSLSSAVVADVTLLDPLRDPDAFHRERTVDGYRASWRDVEPADERGLRRWKRRELLRIAARDLLGAADLPAVGRELAALAQVCLEAALAIARSRGRRRCRHRSRSR